MTKNDKIKRLHHQLGQFKSLYHREKKLREQFSKGVPRFPRLEVNP